MRYLVWTRSKDDWPRDQELFCNLSIPVIHLPCLSTKACSYELPKQRFFEAVAFTSTKAVNYALKDQNLIEILNTTPMVFTLGKAAATALKTIGIKAIYDEAVRNGADFSQFLSTQLQEEKALLWLGPMTMAYDLGADLNAKGIEVHRVAIYETIAQLQLGRHYKRQLISDLNGVVCFASPSAVKGFTDSLTPTKNQLATTLTAAVIGQTTADAARPFFETIVCAPESNLEALAALGKDQLNLGSKHQNQPYS